VYVKFKKYGRLLVYCTELPWESLESAETSITTLVLYLRYCMQFELTAVRRSCSKSSSVGRNKDEVDSGWPSRLTKGAEVCVECQSLAMRRRLGGRCRGHGVLHKETRWVVMAAARTTGCHGKWVLKSRQDSCQCSPKSPLSYILVWSAIMTAHAPSSQTSGYKRIDTGRRDTVSENVVYYSHHLHFIYQCLLHLYFR